MGEVTGLSYPVILRPSDVKFTCKSIPTKFDNGNGLMEVLEEMKQGKILPKEIPPIQVIWYCDLWEWYTINNRRLWLFQQLERMEICKYASMNRVEVMNANYSYPTSLYSEVSLYDPPWDNNVNCSILTTHLLEDGKCSPTGSDDDDDDIRSVLSMSISSPNMKKSRRRRTSSSGTTVGSIEDVYIGDGVTIHTTRTPQPMELDIKDKHNNNVVVKMETDKMSPPSPSTRGRSRSRTRRERSSSWISRSPIKEASKQRSKSKKRSNSRGRNYRSKSVTSMKCERKELSTERKRSPSNKRSRSQSRSRSVGRNVRSKSVSCISRYTDNKSVIKYNSFYTENNRHFKDRTRSKSVTNLLSESSRHNSLYAVNTRYRNRSKTAVNNESEENNSMSLSNRKRSLSPYSHFSARSDSDVMSYGSRKRSLSVCSSHRSVRSNASTRSYQLDKFNHERAPRYQRPRRQKFIENDFTQDYNYTTCREMVKRQDSISSSGYGSSGYGSPGALSMKSGIQLSHLYTLWAARRAEFLQARRDGQLHLMYGPEEGYLCGLCFKKFKIVVDLQQHSEELLHYACITCGRFFNTYTALGQHCNALFHTKD